MTLDGLTGEIITFYSYKGGTGRTMALANVACALALAEDPGNGKGVLMIDWDLEAPGLHRYFRLLLALGRGRPVAFSRSQRAAESEAALAEQQGLIDLFCELEKLCRNPNYTNQSEEVAHDIVAKVQLSHFIVPTSIPRLSLMTAGRFDKFYATKVSNFQWEALYEFSPNLIRAFAERLEQEYRYILIDSRTGLSDISGICAVLMPTTLVAVFNPNLQSIAGTGELIRRAAEYRKSSGDPRPLIVFPLASRVDTIEEELREKWRYGNPSEAIAGYQHHFERIFLDIYELPACDLGPYFDDAIIPHSSDYSYGEEIAVLAKRPGDKYTLRRSYAGFAQRLKAQVMPWQSATEVDAEIDLSRAERERRKRRTLFIKRFAIVGMILIVMASLYFGFKSLSVREEESILRRADLPIDLYGVQNQLDLLSLENSKVKSLEWLRSTPISELEVSGLESIQGIEQAPKLATVTLSFTNSSADGLASLAHVKTLKKLRLFLGGSQIRDLADLAAIPQLETLDLSLGNSDLDFGALARLPRLHKLTLRLHGSRGQNLGAIDQMRNIEDLTLDLDRSSIHELPSLTGLTRLQHLTLKLTASQIQNLNAILALRTLQSLELDLSNSKGTRALPDFSTFTNLTCLNLNLEYTEIRQLPSLAKLRNLQRLLLNLKGTNIQSLPDISLLSHLQDISLDLTSSGVTGLPRLPEHTGIQKITLNLTASTVFDFAQLNRLPYLAELDLDPRFNAANLPDLTHIHGLQKLTLHLNWPQVHELHSLPGLTDLTLYMDSNISSGQAPDASIEQLRPVIQLPELKILAIYLNDSQVTRLPDFGDSSQLEALALHLRRSRIRDLSSLAQLRQLTKLYLDLEGAQDIRTLPDMSILSSLRQLTLHLARSGIQDLSGLAQADQIKTLELDLHESEIKTLPDWRSWNRKPTIVLTLRDCSTIDLAETGKLAGVQEITFVNQCQSLANLPASVHALNFGSRLPQENQGSCPMMLSATTPNQNTRRCEPRER